MKTAGIAVCLVFALNSVYSSTYTMEQGSFLQLQCPGGDGHTESIPLPIGQSGRPGKMGPQGPPGIPGVKEPDSELRRRYEDRIATLEAQLSEEKRSLGRLGAATNPANSCQDLKRHNASAQNGLYHLIDNEANVFLTYCDMTIGGGGWTLVASIHENNMDGHCTTGDRWSSEQGNSAGHPHGDGFWENRGIHGAASSSTSDDYKNSGYFAINATDVMLWHVPNDTPLEDFESEAFLKYHTENGFLQTYGGNLQSLFSKHFPMRSKQFKTNADNGPAIPIVWDKGSNRKMIELTPQNSKAETEPGYIQFRAINYEQNAFALCHGVRIKRKKHNVEHVCVGSTSHNIGHEEEERYCGDFAAKDWSLSPNWNAPQVMINSVIMIFYR